MMLAALAITAAAFTATPSPSPRPEPLLSGASPAAREAFKISGASLTHVASGFSCPLNVGSERLTGIGAGLVPGLHGMAAATCSYDDEAGPDAVVYFSREAGAGELLSDPYCRGLPKALNVGLRRGLPGANRLVGPEAVTASAFAIRRPAPEILSCAWVRAPFRIADEAVRVTAMRQPDGWTIRSVQIPKPAGRLTLPVDFPIRSLVLLLAADNAFVR